MPDLIQRLRDTYASNPAAALKMIPEVIQAADEGKIMELPCKIGTKLWHIYDKDKGSQGCYASEDNIFLIAKRINETVFFTREAAEQALKERKA